MMDKIYSYREQDGMFYILEDAKQLKTPKGVPVTADSDYLADLLLKDLNEGMSYSTTRSYLCYHYTYCDTVAQMSRDELKERMATISGLVDDDYLMFKQTCPVRQPVAQAMENEEIPQLLETCSMKQLVAIWTLMMSTGSYMLPVRIVWDIISELDDECDNYADLLAVFMGDLREYMCTEEMAEDDEELDNWLSEFEDFVAVFVAYFLS